MRTKVSHSTVRNANWSLWRNEDRHTYDGEQVTRAILLDIREELREMNRLLALRLNCFETISIPRTLKAIARNTAKKKRKAVKK